MSQIVVKDELGEDIVTRDHGKRLYALVEGALAQAPSVVVDFDGLLVTSVSFFDEAFGVRARKVGHESFAKSVKFDRIDPFDLALVNDIVLSRSRERVRGGPKVRPIESAKTAPGRRRAG